MPNRKAAGAPKRIETPTADQLRDLLVHLLTGAAGGAEARWLNLIGDVEVLPIVLHPKCNWRVTPTGSGVERDAIAKAVVVVRTAHPYVKG